MNDNQVTGQHPNNDAANGAPAGDLWEDNQVQFPRLLAEIMATQNLDLQALAISMDLSVDDVSSLFDRADTAWEACKRRLAASQGQALADINAT